MSAFLSIIQQNIFIVMIAVVGFMGCVAYNMAGKGLALLYNETCSMTTSNHPFIKQLKLRRENGMRINLSIHNTYAFVLKNIDRYKYLNVPIRDYIKTAWLIQLVCVMLGLVGGVINQNVWYAAYGCVCSIAISCVGKIEDVENRQQQIIINIIDYFDNILSLDKKIVETVEKGDYNKSEMQVPPDAPKSELTNGNPINEEQKRLIEEVLKEYLA